MQCIDVVVQTPEGNHLLLATCPDIANGTRVAAAVYAHYKDAPPSSLQARYVWLSSSTVRRDTTERTNQHLLAAWPDHANDPEGWKESLAAWKMSPRAISGDESEPDDPTARAAMQLFLDKLPAYYQPAKITREPEGYRVTVNHDRVLLLSGKPAREAIEWIRHYVTDYEGHDWELSPSVTNENDNEG